MQRALVTARPVESDALVADLGVITLNVIRLARKECRMQTVYNTFKFLHIAAVIVWIGGLVTTGVYHAVVARERNPAAMASLTRASQFLGRAVVGPAAALTLVAGVVMVVNAGLSFGTLWVAWGLGGILVSLLLGATLIRRAGEELGEATRTGAQTDNPHTVTLLQRRLRNLSILNLVLLFSVVWAMVFKPTL